VGVVGCIEEEEEEEEEGCLVFILNQVH